MTATERPRIVDIQAISEGLTRDETGVWRTSDEGIVSYPVGGHNVFRSIEDVSFWFRHRNRCIVSAVDRFTPHGHGIFADIGGGNGYVSVELSRHGRPVVLLEPGIVGARNALQRGVKNVICAPLKSAKLKAGVFDAVGLFDVIEHIEDDVDFLLEVSKVLSETGLLFITVPWSSVLWSRADIEAGHYRRYSKVTLRRLLSEAGFRDLYTGCLFGPLPLPVFLMRAVPFRLGLNRWTGDSTQASRDHAAGSYLLSELLLKALSYEPWCISRALPLPFGGSIISVAVKDY